MRARRRQMNQRKGRRKWCEILARRTPATLALMALPSSQNFAPFPVCSRATIYKINQHHDCCWISNGLREFWETGAPKLSAALIFLWLLSFY